MHARSSNIITVLASISVADLRSDSSQVQSSKFIFFNHGQGSHDKITSTNPPCASPMDPLINRTYQQSERIPIVPKKFNSFVIKIIMQLAA